jgi:phosphoglycerate dehydrogenase-like enzyme
MKEHTRAMMLMWKRRSEQGKRDQVNGKRWLEDEEEGGKEEGEIKKVYDG